jgi:MFS family permease
MRLTSKPYMDTGAVFLDDAGDAPSESDKSDLGTQSTDDEQSKCSANNTDDDSQATLPSIEEQISVIGFGPFHKRCLLLFCLIASTRGIDLTFQNELRPYRLEQWNLNLKDYVLYCLISASFCCLGFLFGGILADRHGRHGVLLASGIIYVLSTMCKAIAPDALMFCTMHCLGELCAGFELPIVLSLAQELFPRPWRSKCIVVLLGSGLFVGYLFIAVIDNVAVLAFNMAHTLNSWRLLVAVSTIPHIIAIFILWSKTPESPRWLLTKGRRRMCSILLKFIAEENGSELQLLMDGEIRAGNVVDFDHSFPSALMSSSFLRVWIICALSLLVSLSFSVFVFLLMPSISEISVSALLNNQSSVIFLQPMAIATCLLMHTFAVHQTIAGTYAFASCISAALYMDSLSTWVTTGLNLLLLCSLFVAWKQTLVLTVESFPTAFRCSCVGLCLCLSGIITACGYAAMRSEALLHSSTSYALMCLVEMVLSVMMFLIPRETWLGAQGEWPEWSAESPEEFFEPGLRDGCGGQPAAAAEEPSAGTAWQE